MWFYHMCDSNSQEKKKKHKLIYSIWNPLNLFNFPGTHLRSRKDNRVATLSVPVPSFICRPLVLQRRASRRLLLTSCLTANNCRSLMSRKKTEVSLSLMTIQNPSSDTDTITKTRGLKHYFQTSGFFFLHLYLFGDEVFHMYLSMY